MMRKSSVLLYTLLSSSLCYSADSVIAHRGVHHTYDRSNLQRDTCTAERIFPPTHGLFENTLASISAAFSVWADWVEIDIHPTTDGRFAVFHDWTIDCRTNGKGVTREQSLAYLKTLDIGFGYTADNGLSFPLRGKGVGLIPSLTEVLTEFPDKRLLINFKSREMREATHLAIFLSKLSADQKRNLMVYGGTEEMLSHVNRVSTVTVWPSKPTIKKCYLVILFSLGKNLGRCHGRIFGGPLWLAEKIPGWPNDFISRVKSSGGQFYVMGIDSKEDLNRLGQNYKGGVWTDRIELIGPLIKKKEYFQ